MAQGNYKYDVFVSYFAKETKEVMKYITGILGVLGFKVFDPDYDMNKEQDVNTETMQRAVRASRCCIVLLSPSYFSSKYCRAELRAALEANQKMVLPAYSSDLYGRKEIEGLISAPVDKLKLPEEDDWLRKKLFQAQQLRCLHSSDTTETGKNIKEAMEHLTLLGPSSAAAGVGAQSGRPADDPLSAGRQMFCELDAAALAALCMAIVPTSDDDAAALLAQKMKECGLDGSMIDYKEDTKVYDVIRQRQRDLPESYVKYVVQYTKPYRQGGQLASLGVLTECVSKLPDLLEHQDIGISGLYEKTVGDIEKGYLDLFALLPIRGDVNQESSEALTLVAMLEVCAVIEAGHDQFASNDPRLSTVRHLRIQSKKQLLGSNFRFFSQIFATGALSELRVLQMAKQMLNSQGISAMQRAVEKSGTNLPHLSELDISENQLDSGCSNDLASLIMCMPALRTIKLKNNLLNTDNLVEIVKALAANAGEVVTVDEDDDDEDQALARRPITIDLRFNKIKMTLMRSSTTVEEFANAFATLNISKLDLSHCDVDYAKALAEPQQLGCGMLYCACDKLLRQGTVKRFTLNLLDEALRKDGAFVHMQPMLTLKKQLKENNKVTLDLDFEREYYQQEEEAEKMAGPAEVKGGGCCAIS